MENAPSRESPDADAVFRRALCLMLLAVRGLGEGAVESGEAPAGGVHESLRLLIEDYGLNDALTTGERALLEVPLGSLSNFQFAQLIGLEDALRILLWALGVIDDPGSHLSAPEQSFELYQIMERLAADPPSAWTLRDRQEIAETQMVEDVWLWRYRVAATERKANAPEGLRDHIRTPLRYAEAAGYIELIDDDIAVNGKPFSALSEYEYRMVGRSAQMRSVALLWLMGLAADWERVYAFLVMREQRSGLEPPDFTTPPPPPGRDWPRPDERAIGQRVVALTTLFLRTGIEADARRSGSADLPQSFSDRLTEFASTLSPHEAELIARQPGRWTPEEFLGATWRLEALGCLLWALGRVEEIPSYDTPFTPDLLSLLKAAATGGTSRPQAELDRARSIAETWHWRDRTMQLVRAGRASPPGLPPVAEIIKVTARAAHERGQIPPPIDHDFPAFGRPYRLLSDEEHALAGSIARERHYAFNWLCGYAPDWDSVRTDT